MLSFHPLTGSQIKEYVTMPRKKAQTKPGKTQSQKLIRQSARIYGSKQTATYVRESSPRWISAWDSGAAGPDLQMMYRGKKTESEILSCRHNIQLKEIASYGQIHLHSAPNFLIEGENFAVLRLLLDDKKIAGKVREVYIDPPFSTGQEFRIGKTRTATISSRNGDPIAYKDKLSGAQFLEFLRERLVLLRELLADDGSIYLHIDYKIGHYVKIVMDEVFGPGNFINNITRIKCNPKNFSRKGYGNVKDMVLFYSKTKNFLWNEPRVEMTEEDIKRLFSKVDDQGRRYTTTPLHAPGETQNGDTGKKWNGLFPPSGRHWRVSRNELTRLNNLNLIEWSKTGNPRKKIYADEILSKGKKLQDVWELKDPPYPAYPTEKNLDLLKRIICASSRPGDIVLDCFVGSGTTLAAAELCGRRWIGIDQSKAAIQICLSRLTKIENVSEFILLKAV